MVDSATTPGKTVIQK